MARNIAEESNALKISFLKSSKILDDNYNSGTLSWTRGLSDKKDSIGYTLVKNSDKGDYIRLQYIQTDRWSGEKSELDYKVKLTTTKCNYNGKRYWFVCPLTKNGQYCGRRVGVLYLSDKYFGCRHCLDIAYAAQAESKSLRWLSGVTFPDIEKAESEVKRKFYRGRPTRKYRRLQRMEDKLIMGMLLCSKILK